MPACDICRSELEYIHQYGAWYCRRCQAYRSQPQQYQQPSQPPSQYPQPQPYQQPPAPSRLCPGCGQRIPVQYMACPYCGKKF